MDVEPSAELELIAERSIEEAQRTGFLQVAAAHLVLGMLRSDNSGRRLLQYFLGGMAAQQKLKNDLEKSLGPGEDISYERLDDITLSDEAQSVLSMSLVEAFRADDEDALGAHLLLSILKAENETGRLLRKCGLSYEAALNAYTRLFRLRRNGSTPQKESREEITHIDTDPSDTGQPDLQLMKFLAAGVGDEDNAQAYTLEECTSDLTEAARQGKLDPVSGRDREIDRVIRILGRRRKNNPMLVGEPGVGKSAVVEGIARRIAFGQVPPALEGKKILSLDIASLVAGTKYRGEFESRIKAILKEVESRSEIILFIDEFHTVVGAGSTEGSMDAANIMKPALSRGGFQCIGATTTDEFVQHIEKDGALERRFQKVVIEKTDESETLSILLALRPGYEEHHGVKYPLETLEACIRMSERYIPDRCLPDKAIDVMDEAGSLVNLRCKGEGQQVQAEDVAAVIGEMTRIPAGKVAVGEGERLLGMATELKKQVIGQDAAVDCLCRAICRSRAGIKDPSRPVGSFLFLGPSGVGKTLLAKKLAEYLFDSTDNMLRLDMSEYSESISLTRLIGTPPGYVGFNQEGLLSEPVRRKPYSVVLLDEIEKAHPDIFNLLLQVMDEGRLTDSHGRSVDFRNTIIIMTSNTGSQQLSSAGSGIGFTAASPTVAEERRMGIIRKAVEHTFPAEFLGRLDGSIFFSAISKEDAARITELELDKIRQRVKEAGLGLRISKTTKQKLLQRGFDPEFGARPLRKAIQELVEDPAAEKIMALRLEKAGERPKNICV